VDVDMAYFVALSWHLPGTYEEAIKPFVRIAGFCDDIKTGDLTNTKQKC
jgi:hypothetical protein